MVRLTGTSFKEMVNTSDYQKMKTQNANFRIKGNAFSN